jgi:ribosome biogenesis protein BRX1
MAAVYKSISKKKARQLTEDSEEDLDVPMDELLEDADDTTDSEEEEEEGMEDRIAEARKQLAAGFMPKTRVLILTSRGVTHRLVPTIIAIEPIYGTY